MAHGGLAEAGHEAPEAQGCRPDAWQPWWRSVAEAMTFWGSPKGQDETGNKNRGRSYDWEQREENGAQEKHFVAWVVALKYGLERIPEPKQWRV